jgi:tetratricopeptide (TPR) repeat protein
LAGAVAYYDQALAIYREIGNVLGEGLALNDLAIVAREQRNYPFGQELCQQALKIGQEIGNQELQRRALYNLGHLYSDQERYFQAAAAYEQALEKTARTQPLQRLHPLSGLAYIATQTGGVERAKGLVDEVMAIIEMRKIDGTDEPMRIVWNVQRSLNAIGPPYLSQLQSLVPQLLQHLPADPTLAGRSA